MDIFWRIFPGSNLEMGTVHGCSGRSEYTGCGLEVVIWDVMTEGCEVC